MSGRLFIGQPCLDGVGLGSVRLDRVGLIRIAKWLLLGFFLLTASSCVQFTGSTRNDSESFKNAVVARDLLFAMAQVLPSSDTTIQHSEPNSEFGQELLNGLREMGYGLQRMQADQGPRYMSYSELSRSTSSHGGTATYSLFVGDVGFERVYVNVDDNRIAPLGPITVFGTQQQLVLNDQLFPGGSLEVSYATSTEPEIDPTAITAITVIDEEIMEAISNLQSQNLPSYKTLNSQNQVIGNLFHLGSSNFSQVNRDFRLVRRAIVIFPNESLLLLEKGREQIDKLVSFYRPNSDVIRLVGCSNGPTMVEGGNEKLALGRSKRIAQELVSRKVQEQDILDEGCWASESSKRFPPRGVVVELQRRNS